MQPHRRSRPITLLLAVLALLALAAACGDDEAAGAGEPTSTEATDLQPLTLRVGYIGTQPVWGGPEGYAHAQGLLLEALEPHGVAAIEAFQFGNGPDLNQALTGGSLDIGIYGDTPAINARAAGAGTRVINQARVGLEALLFTPVDGPTSVADLAGGTIGVPQGSYMHRFVLGLLEEEGLADAVSVTNLLVPDAAAALDRGDVDAFAAPWTLAPLLEARGFPILTRTFPDHPQLAGSSVTVITEELLADRPGIVEGWNQARADVLALIAADPEPYYDAQQPVLGVDRALVPELERQLADYPTEPFTDDGLELLAGTKAFLVGIGAARTDFDLAEWQYQP